MGRAVGAFPAGMAGRGAQPSRGQLGVRGHQGVCPSIHGVLPPLNRTGCAASPSCVQSTKSSRMFWKKPPSTSGCAFELSMGSWPPTGLSRAAASLLVQTTGVTVSGHCCPSSSLTSSTGQRSPAAPLHGRCSQVPIYVCGCPCPLPYKVGWHFPWPRRESPVRSPAPKVTTPGISEGFMIWLGSLTWSRPTT